MSATLDTRRVRQCTTSQLHHYYKTFLGQTSEELGTQQILQAIERGSIAPITFAPWLNITNSPSAIAAGLQQNFSVIVRHSSTMHLGKTLCSSRWKHVWDGVGGTAGLLKLFADLSVHDVRTACKLLAVSGRGRYALEKRNYITELFMGLQPHIFPDAPFKTTDRRPLPKFYRHLIPACTEELVERIVIGDLKGKWKVTRDELLMQCHPNIVRKEQLAALRGESGAKIDSRRLEGLVNQYPTGHSTSGFSQSMNFSLQVLRVLVDNDKTVLDDAVFIDDLVRPLLRRALRKQADWSNTQEIVDLTMQYLEKHPHAGSAISNSVGDVRHLVALCWAYKPERFDGQLRKLCSDPRFGASKCGQASNWTDFLTAVPKKRRYALLRLCLQESTGYDIDKADDLKKAEWNFNYELAEKFNAQEALDLFTRFRAARPDKNLMTISLWHTILQIGLSHRTIGHDNDLFHVHFLCCADRNEEAQSLARQRIEVRKKEAAAGKEPEHRTFFAKSALYFAIASGDIKLYREVLQWTKRFSRDQKVYSELYGQCYTREVYALLAGSSAAFTSSTKSEIKSRVQLGNAVLQDLFDTACAAVREPSFQAYGWATTLELFQKVVQNRIDSSSKLKKQVKASDEEMYSMVWKDTLEMLLAVEEKAHRSENTRLEATAPRGPCDVGATFRLQVTNTEPSTYRFFDNLAKARDSLWGKLRSSRHPAVLALPKPFPRGLPLQQLTGSWILSEPKLEDLAPYIASRAKAVLFLDPAEALTPAPNDEESKAAFGHFVDSYNYALQIYIPESCDKIQRIERVSQVWSHLVGPLSSGRMSEEEATRYFSKTQPQYLQKYWPPSSQSDAESSTWPLLPEVDDPTERHEWNPFNAGRPDSPGRDLDKLTYIDCTLLVNEDRQMRPIDPWAKWSFSGTPKISGNEVDIVQIWNSDRNMGEGGVLSALLYLEMMYGSTYGSLLERPFPSAHDARYPSLYLEGDFRDESLNCYSAVRHIGGHLDNIAPALLHLSAKNMIAELAASDRDEHSDGSVQELAFTLLLRLGESDKPVLAQDMAINIILNRPTASSWHRLLMKPCYLRRMSASDARNCFKAFAEAVLQRMQMSKNDREKAKDVTSQRVIESAPSKPAIKVTTSKFLAQLLNGTEFVDEDSAFAILSTLLKMGTHEDVRLNITKTLLAMLDGSSPELAEKVFAALATLVPVAGNLHELKFMGESDWKTAEETLSPPAFPDIDGQSPTGKLFIDYYLDISNDSEYRQTFLNRILLPTITHRQAQIARWNSLFLKKYGVDDTNLEVPVMPPYATRLLQKDLAPFLPASLLVDVVSYTLFRIAPPASIEAMHTTLKANNETMACPEVFPWFQANAGGADAIMVYRRFDLLAMLETCTGENEITPSFVKEKFFEVFKAAILADAPLYERLTGSLLANFLNGNYMMRPWWTKHGKPMLSEMIEYVESLRTKIWEENADRKPSVLPNTFPWRLLLLVPPFPTPSPSSTVNNEEKCKSFAKQLTSTIETHLATPLYHTKLAQLKTYLDLDPVSQPTNLRAHKIIAKKTIRHDKKDHAHESLQENRLRTATFLGSLEAREIRIAQVLAVELACHLLGLVRDDWSSVAKDLKERVREMVKIWRGCADEGVRRVGWGLEWVFK
jgi:hypothetical protein